MKRYAGFAVFNQTVIDTQGNEVVPIVLKFKDEAGRQDGIPVACAPADLDYVTNVLKVVKKVTPVLLTEEMVKRIRDEGLIIIPE